MARINPSSLQRSFNTIIIQIEILAENTILMKKGNRLPRAATTPLVGQLLLPHGAATGTTPSGAPVQKLSDSVKNIRG